MKTQDSGRASSPARGAQETKRKKADQRRPPAEILPVLAVEGAGVAFGVLAGRVPLDTPLPATALTRPAHRVPLGDEAEPMPEQAAANHDRTPYPAGAGR